MYHSNSPVEPSKLRVSKHKLPPMTSMMMQIRHEFNMDVEERYSSGMILNLRNPQVLVRRHA